MKSEDYTKKELVLRDYQGEDRIVTSHELAERLKNEPQPKVQNTGFPSIDRILNGVESGELIVVSGPPGHGKTTLLMSMTTNMMKDDLKSVWFTLEVTPRQFITKMSASGELPFFYLPNKNIDNHIQWLLDRIIEANVKYNAKIVYIDHLHQIFSIEKSKGNVSLELGDIVAQLKQLAIEYGLVIFLIAHSTDNKINPKAEPTMRDIRDSGMITRLADSVMGVWRVKKQTNKQDLIEQKMSDDFDEDDNWAKIRIWKNRREGKLGSFYAQHENHILTELDIDHLPERSTQNERKALHYKKYGTF